jgi:hypothetical protein
MMVMAMEQGKHAGFMLANPAQACQSEKFCANGNANR